MFGFAWLISKRLQVKGREDLIWRTWRKETLMWYLLESSSWDKNLGKSECNISLEIPVEIPVEIPAFSQFLQQICSLLIVIAKLYHRDSSWILEFPPPLGIPVSDYWQANYMAAFRSIRETKLQAFQFKVLHRLIPCNKYLKNIRVKNDEACAYCNEVDSLSHFLFYCPTVQRFWVALCNWSSQQINLPLEMFQCKNIS